jgi:putative oxidoreductase
MAKMPKCWCLTWPLNFLFILYRKLFMNNALNLIGRILLAALFLPAGLSKLSGFEGTVGYIGSVGLPIASVAAAAAIAVEILGSVALIVGFQTRITSAVLAVFTIVASVFFHAFWAAAPEQAFVQQLLFFKNIGVIGGLLVLVSSGAGAWSIDAKKEAQ